MSRYFKRYQRRSSTMAEVFEVLLDLDCQAKLQAAVEEQLPATSGKLLDSVRDAEISPNPYPGPETGHHGPAATNRFIRPHRYL